MAHLKLETIIHSCNGWDPLKEIIVGDVTGARVPPFNLSMKNFMYANLSDNKIKSLVGSYDKQVIEETNEDLDMLAKTLNDLHIRVYRPEKRVYGWMNYCPRDIFLVLNDTIIETPCVMSERINESFAYKHILNNIDRYGKWIQAPTPQYLEESFNFDDLSKPTLMNEEIMFDAPNVVRMGKTLLYQISNSGNLKGYEWLCQTFPEYDIHIANHYSGAHFDTTVIPLRPGLVLLNGHRCSKDNYPEIFKKWDKIFFTDIIDQYSENSAIASSVIGLNILSINEKTVMVDKNQTPLIKELKKYNIDSIPMSLRHAKTLGGGFHCVTLDLHREGKLEQYDF
ncbi:inosamine-phosphate amidinotransferase 1 [Candidatus Woesearchaeota archaeon]|nr:inosamine-phosphate amidinotransferase 1 [Candidatus Woesearchaeota archaeon]MBT7558275.1 inosamine-phosphate amidinotransferase 1 [Candidatus Woesearchaeota archaeon]